MPSMLWWPPDGYRTWTCDSCGHHSIAYALGTCPTCGTDRDAEPAAPRPARAARKPAARKTTTRRGLVMAKAAVAVVATVFGTAGSSGLGPAFGAAAVTPVVNFTPHQNPDHSAVKDTRT